LELNPGAAAGLAFVAVVVAAGARAGIVMFGLFAILLGWVVIRGARAE